MSNGIIALIVVGSVMAYALVAGVVSMLLPQDWRDSSHAEEQMALRLGTALWPLVLPFIVLRLVYCVGARVASWRPSRLPKATAREVER